MGLYPPIVKSNVDVLTRRLGGVEWFVDSSFGSNAGSRSGNRPEKPLLTIAEALDRCTAGRYNIINVLAPGHVTEANPIVVDKSYTWIRGVPSISPYGDPPTTLVATVNDSYFTLAATDITISDLTIHGGAAHPAIEFNAVAWSQRNVIHNCVFRAGLWGIAMGGDPFDSAIDSPSHHWAISNCKFEGTLTGGGIYVDSNGSWGTIANNYFDRVPFGIAFPNTHAGAAHQVLDNRFVCPTDDVVGRAILLTAGTSCLLTGNVAGFNQTAAMTFNPFVDTPNTNFWVNNYGSAPAAGAELVPG